MKYRSLFLFVALAVSAAAQSFPVKATANGTLSEPSTFFTANAAAINALGAATYQPLDATLTGLAGKTTTGTGNIVLSAGATLTTPTLGVASATSLSVNPSSGTAKGRAIADQFRADVLLYSSNFNGSTQDDNTKPSWSLTLDSRVAGDAFRVNRIPPGGSETYLLNLTSTGLVLLGDLTVASTATLKGLRTADASLNFASMAAGAGSTVTVTVTGAAVGNAVVLTTSDGAAPPDEISLRAYVSATNTVSVRAVNRSAGTYDPAAQTYRVVVIAF